MKLTVDTGVVCRRLGEDAAFCLIKKTGFDGVDYSLITRDGYNRLYKDEYIKNALETKMLLEKHSLVCDQVHAPFVFKYEDTFCEGNERFAELVRSIEYASIIGAKYIVVHYIKNDIPFDDDYISYNLEFYKSFIPYLEKFNVKIAVENLYRRNPFKSFYGALLCDPHRHLEFMKKLDSEYFGICLDIGHSAVTGYLPEDSIKVLGKNISITHIQDTDYERDSHMPPFTMSHNWDKIASAFAETGYEGNISLEVPTFLSKLDDDMLKAGLSFCHSGGRKLIQKINSYK